MLLGIASNKALSAVKMETGIASKSRVIKPLVQVLSLALTKLIVDELVNNPSGDASFILLNHWVYCTIVAIHLTFCESISRVEISYCSSKLQ